MTRGLLNCILGFMFLVESWIKVNIFLLFKPLVPVDSTGAEDTTGDDDELLFSKAPKIRVSNSGSKT